jgi:hypothetical protein
VRQQRLLLFRSRLQPEPRHIRKLSVTTDISEAACQPPTENQATLRIETWGFQTKGSR